MAGQVSAEPLPPLDIEEGRKLLAGATEGPWDFDFGRDYNPSSDPPDDGDWPTLLIPAVAADRRRTPGREWMQHPLTNANGDADAALIVWLRNNAEALLAAAEERDRLREALNDVIVWLEAEADHPRPTPGPAMKLQARQARAALGNDR